MAEVPLLTLITDSTERADATMPLRWCVSKEALGMLQEAGATDPYIFILIQHGFSETARYLVPLKDEMRFIEFRRPGRNIIHAAIVWEHKNGRFLERSLMRKDGYGDYRCSFIEPHPKNFVNGYFVGHETYSDQYQSLGATTLDVEVPQNMFAKEPPRWLSAWVNYWFTWAPVDQCHFRRRMLVAFTIQPIAVLVAVIVEFALKFGILLGLAFLGIPGRWKKLLSPDPGFGDSVSDLYPGKSSIFFSGPRRWYRPFLWLISPPALLLAYIYHLAHPNVPWSDMLILLCGMAVCWILGELVVESMVWSLKRIIQPALDRLFDHLRFRTMESIPAREPQRNLVEELSYLACDRTPRVASVKALAPERQTLYLRFQDIKSKVCRPFAR